MWHTGYVMSYHGMNGLTEISVCRHLSMLVSRGGPGSQVCEKPSKQVFGVIVIRTINTHQRCHSNEGVTKLVSVSTRSNIKKNMAQNFAKEHMDYSWRDLKIGSLESPNKSR